jgi:hypothetical protein
MWFAVCAYLSFGAIFYAWMLGTAERASAQLLLVKGDLEDSLASAERKAA